MGRILFAIRNLRDKIGKIIGNPGLIKFYFQVYFFSRLKKEKPNIYIVSYPKCGRTWLRLMLQRYIDEIGLPIKDYKNKAMLGLPDGRAIKFEHDHGGWVPAPPKIENMKFKKSKYKDKTIVFLVRDPKDILVSSWYHLKYRESIYLKGLSEFIDEELVGIQKIISFMNLWCENNRIPDKFLLLYYEELHKNTVATFHKLLLFLEIPVDDKSVEKAVDKCSFEKMKAMEKSGSHQEPWMKPGTRKLKNSMKIRKGKVGGFADELSKEEILYIDNIIKEQMNKSLVYSEL